MKKVGIIGHVGHENTAVAEAILRLREVGNEVIVVGESADELTKNKSYDGSLDELLKSKIESFKIEPLPLLPEIFSEYKSGRENRRERRKQERKNK